MTLQGSLDTLRSKVHYPHNYIQILFGDAWEVQFYCNKKMMAVGTHRIDLKLAVMNCLEQLKQVEAKNKWNQK